MKFAIRDDDICFHTNSQDLENIYGDILDDCPVSFSCIPFVGGCSSDGMSPDELSLFDNWWQRHLTEETFDIAHNGALVQLVKKWIKDGKATVMLHGINHKLYEFVTADDLTEDIRLAKLHISQVFNHPVCVASPPNNSLSASSSAALSFNNLNILTAFGHKPNERQPSLENISNFVKIFALYIKYGKRFRYPFPLKFSDHYEQPCYHLGPQDSYESLELGLKYAISRDGNFVLATHFYHLVENPYLVEIIKRLISSAKQLTNGSCSFVCAEALFE